MSSIRFHTRDETLTVRGQERHNALHVTTQVAAQVLGVDDPARLNSLIREGALPREALAFTLMGKTPAESVQSWLLDLSGFNMVVLEGDASPVSHAVLNTAAVEGPAAVAFLARLHGSVEDRIWIAADDVSWFSDVLAQGRADGTLRPDMGWEAVIEHLTATDSPVIISSSQGANFPDEEWDEATGDVVPAEDPAALWTESLGRLQQQGWWLHLTPDNLREPAYAPLQTLHALAGAGRGKAI